MEIYMIETTFDITILSKWSKRDPLVVPNFKSCASLFYLTTFKNIYI